MKESVYKFFSAVFIVLIFWGMLHAMRLVSDLNDYNYLKRSSEKNSGIIAAGPEIPAVSAKAPAEAMRTEPQPITAEELSYIYLDGIKFDFPCTLAQLQEHFDTENYYSYYDEEHSEYRGQVIFVKNGICSYVIAYISESKDSPPEECIVTTINSTFGYSEKYSPQIVAAGIDLNKTSEEEYLHLAALDENEYLSTSTIIQPSVDDGYIAFDFIRNKVIRYYKSDDPLLQEVSDSYYPFLIKTELRLPEDYDMFDVSETKEELRDFVHKYYVPDKYRSDYYRREEIQETVDNFYLTAYEFLALDDDYDAEYYEITDLKRITEYDLTDGYKTVDTGYFEVTANCCINGYDKPVKTEMVLKPGEPLGSALIIQIDI